MTRKYRSPTSKRVSCPHCNHAVTKITCNRVYDTLRVRYRKCPECSHTFKTEQVLEDATAPEILVPPCTAREWGEQRAKLSPDDVREIKAQLERSLTSQVVADLHGVSLTTINYIRQGRRWAHVN